MMQVITDMNIQYEDKELLVVYKPAGLATQSARVTSPDLVSSVTRHLKGAPVYVVHRLDQPVEGLLVLAKTKQAAAGLSKQLQAGTLNKQYYALVYRGAEELPKEGILADYLWKNPQTQKAEIVAQASGKGKQAKLHYRVMTGKDDIALLDVRIETGRFHQIRAQLAHAGFPILGDQKYGTQTSMERSEELGIKNVSLFAYALTFTHPKTGKQMEFQAKTQNLAISHLLTTMN
jgi:23S rRNA pseudouridine1911/1915/1917 synthase